MINDPIEIAKQLKELLPKVTTDKVAFTDAAELVIEMSLDHMDSRDLREFYYETMMDRYNVEPAELQSDGEYFTEMLFEDEDEIIIPFKD